MTAGLEIENVSKRFGGVAAVRECSISVPAGRITGLIGPNGAGKSTLFNLCAGLHTPDAGRILLDGEDVTGLAPRALFAKGLARTFQLAHEFATLSALENLMMVPKDQPGETLANAVFRRGAAQAHDREIREKAEEALGFLNLAHVAHERAGNLSGGQKKLLELGRTMMAEPKIVLLDEVAAGVNRTLLNDLAGMIERLNAERGYTFFMIEHDIDLIARLCSKVVVMAEGTVMREGTPAEIRRDPAVIEAYFGGAPAEGAA